MKFIKRPISLPEDLHKWAQWKVKLIARERCTQPNFSAFIATLLAEERRRIESKKAA